MNLLINITGLYNKGNFISYLIYIIYLKYLVVSVNIILVKLRALF